MENNERRGYRCLKTAKKVLDMLDGLYAENRLTCEEYKALFNAIERGPLLVGAQENYTVFLIDGAFGDVDDPSIDYIRIDDVDWRELGVLLRVAMRQDFDMVVRACEE